MVIVILVVGANYHHLPPPHFPHLSPISCGQMPGHLVRKESCRARHPQRCARRLAGAAAGLGDQQLRGDLAYARVRRRRPALPVGAL